MNEIVRGAGKAIKYWWLLLLSGILTFVVGIVVFRHPAQSYLALGLLFGIMMIVSGIIDLVTAVTSRNYFMMRGYVVIGGILDLTLGIFLCYFPRITLVLLPVVLGIWLLYHSFMVIGFGADLNSFRIKGSGWTIAAGVLMLVMSILVLVMPLTVGVATVVTLTGIALLLFGLLFIIISLRLRKIHDYFKYDDAEMAG